MSDKNKAVFLDRDGTINVEKNYLFRIEDWEWIEKAVDAIKGFNSLNYLVIVITNQAGIARGYYKEKDVRVLHEFVNKELEKRGAKIDGYYMCPHHPDYNGQCDCRKPKPGLIQRAKNKFNIDLDSSFMIGDKISDIDAGKSLGITSYLVKTGHGNKECNQLKDSTLVFDDLYDVYNYIKWW